MKRVALLLSGVLVFCFQPAVAEERILSFDSVLEVLRDGSMTVTETITVKAEGKKIRRGIYRDFPTRYKDRYGANYNVAFEVAAVLRDGKTEPWFTKDLKNGVRVYIGRSNVFLQPGEYTYTLKYRTNRQLGFFDDHDELYWNVTGNGWVFPIDRAGATVRLPADIPVKAAGLLAYTGRQGARGRDYIAEIDARGDPRFVTTKPLDRFEGLTIVTMWPKGHIEAPGFFTRIGWFADDNPGFFYGASGLVLLLGFYLFAWRSAGRDPQRGVIFPHYEPPEHFSPASIRFIKRMAYDHKTVATALVNLAVNGHVSIYDEGSSYGIEKHVDSKKPMAPGEKRLLSKLVPGTRQELDRLYHERISGAIEAHKNSLKNNYEKIYFLTNSGWFYFGALISLVIVLATVTKVADSFVGGLVGVFAVTVIGLVGGKALLSLSERLTGLTRSGGRGTSPGSMGGILGLVIAVGTLSFMGFIAYQFTGALAQDSGARIGLVVFLASVLIINGVFYQLMKAPTMAGRRLLDKIEGFEEYLSVAEESDLRLRNPPARTPELFEKYLPYAMALDVEDVWGKKFTAVLRKAQRDGTYKQPRWYRGSNFGSISRPGAFAGAVASSLAVSAASASTPPGSSSGGFGGGGGGGGGGGSSGGGGGGGGGGGW